MMAPNDTRRLAMETLRREAYAVAQQAMHVANEFYFREARRNAFLDDRWTAAERMIDLIDAELERLQVNDPEAPTFGIFTCEAEARGAFGDR